MTILNCKMCGGDIELSADKTYGTCDSCGSNTTFPKIDDEQKTGLFNRGNALRMRGEYDKAAAVFERIIEQDETDAEAHWCLALCRYGIEYVEDPKSGERIPTCHRASYHSFLNDLDYIAAVKHSDSDTAGIYTQAAKRIAEIQKAILTISKQEEPFDVFICYKETTDGGSRSKDSAIAQEIYYELTEAGYKVFFSRITLEAKLGTEYEPYIFAALNSAKVMVLVGTSVEHFTAVWVKNEWSRFLGIMKNDRSRLLIPCYRDMDPYDLPDELAVLQSQDMSKIGFMQDLTRGISKVLEAKTASKTAKTTSDSVTVASLERLIQNSDTYLKLTNYPAAREVFDRVTKEYPEDHRGWWGLIVCETKGLTVVASDVSALNRWFQYVKQLADAEGFSSLEAQYVAYTKIVADEDATNEIIAINNTVHKVNADINKLTSRRNQLEHSKHQRKITFDRRTATYDNAIHSALAGLATCEKDVAIRKSIKVLGGMLLILVFLILSYGEDRFNSLFYGSATAVFGIYMLFFKYKDKNGIEWQAMQGNANAQVENTKRAKAVAANQYDKDIKELNDQIDGINNKIAKADKRIAAYETYLAHGKSKLSEMFFARRCADFGVAKQFDIETESLREAAFAQGTDATDASSKSFEGVEMTCPACQERHIVDQSELKDGAAIVCDRCGSMIQMGADHSPEQDMSFEVTCPLCNNTVFLRQDVVNSGSGKCPSCGAFIKSSRSEYINKQTSSSSSFTSSFKKVIKM